MNSYQHLLLAIDFFKESLVVLLGSTEKGVSHHVNCDVLMAGLKDD